MSDVFRELLCKVGSGTHTSKDLKREEAALATQMMLNQEATPAQIGAFLIAHRIKRPTAEEMAGMLDAYHLSGPQLPATVFPYPVMVMGSPYDGRSRTAPLSPLTALMLSAVGYPVLLHGGRTMPTKYGIPLIAVWQGLGIDWTGLSLETLHQVFAETALGFVYLPRHHPLAETLVPYREQIGKRPPLATLELMWCPYQGEATIVAGYVHPPTEGIMVGAMQLHKTQRFILVKGLEGSCDLPRDRTCIIGLGGGDRPLERLLLNARDYDLQGSEVPLDALAELVIALKKTLQGEPGVLTTAAIWNGGFYLWQAGLCLDLKAGLAKARQLLETGVVAQQLERVAGAIANQSESPC
jgi:anthranilate phosphoribosyltransferase